MECHPRRALRGFQRSGKPASRSETQIKHGLAVEALASSVRLSRFWNFGPARFVMYFGFCSCSFGMSQSASESDRFDLQRFAVAQDALYSTVTNELRAGRKRTHWIWFVFPQVEGLGHSSTAQRYAIHSRDETLAYLAHPLLSSRLLECTELVLGNTGRTAHEIFGSPDDLKFRSSMTLFGAVSARSIFRTALDRFYNGIPDDATLAILTKWAS
jgi:uncharacterized protein (DUF1810 family)